MAETRILFMGDIVGGIGRRTVEALLPALRERLQPTFVVANTGGARVHLVGECVERLVGELASDLLTLVEARAHLLVDLIYASATDTVVRMVEEQMAPGNAQEPRGIGSAEQRI